MVYRLTFLYTFLGLRNRIFLVRLLLNYNYHMDYVYKLHLVFVLQMSTSANQQFQYFWDIRCPHNASVRNFDLVLNHNMVSVRNMHHNLSLPLLQDIRFQGYPTWMLCTERILLLF